MGDVGVWARFGEDGSDQDWLDETWIMKLSEVG